MPKRQRESKNIGLGFLFISIVIFVVILSLAFKTFDIISSSKFNDKSNFYILLKENNGWENIVISPKDSSTTILNLRTKDKSFASFSLPYDLFLDYSEEVNEDNFTSVIPSILRKSGANPFDFLKIVLFIHQNPDVSIENVNSSDERQVREIPQFISDPSILSENLTIEVSNATGVSGVASVFAKMITNMGGNVVLISTEPTTQKDSQIITSDFESITAKKLKNMFELKLDKSHAKISDVKIVIGKGLLEEIIK